jgi:hypothetical protein
MIIRLSPSTSQRVYLGESMKQIYIVEFNPTHTQDNWSRMEFTSITKALGFVSLMVKQGCHCQMFKG